MGTLQDYLEEIRVLGIKDAGYRAWMLFNRYSGLSEKRYPVKRLNKSYLTDALPPEVPAEDARFYVRWQENAPPFFCGRDNPAHLYQAWLGSQEIDRLIKQGHYASSGRIQGFRRLDFDYGNPPDWGLDPLNHIHFPVHRHSTQTLSDAAAGKGDIKCVWEIGRFLHLADIVRAFMAGRETVLIDRMFEQIELFAYHNPLHQGPHWSSEQEVGIRSAMLAFTLYALKGSACLDGQRIRLLWTLICAGAEYCFHHINYARFSIYNNHLIGGALGMYLAGFVVPMHRFASAWKKRGRQILRACLKDQWYEDGGYIQPSHNYHRLAWSYLLWVLRLAEIDHDIKLKNEILARMETAFKLLMAMVDVPSGRLPNWGPNDGACFAPLTACDFADFRPLLASLSYALYRTSPFEPGPWDEMLFWLWGPEALDRAYEPWTVSNTSFPKAGLHLMVQAESKAVLRCGPVLSRFGQQADQLHLDVWHQGQNVLQDAGSYLYHHEIYHEWFRSTSAHNTVVVNGKSQMKPYRKFMFLYWPKAKLIDLPPPPEGINHWLMGVHDGYFRAPEKVMHGRLVCDLGDDRWLVVDILDALKRDQAVTFDQCWHFLDGPMIRNAGRIGITLPGVEYGLAWSGASQVNLKRASNHPPDGWLSRYYGSKTPSPSIHLVNRFKGETMMATAIGPWDSLVIPETDVESNQVTCGNITFNHPLIRQP